MAVIYHLPRAYALVLVAAFSTFCVSQVHPIGTESRTTGPAVTQEKLTASQQRGLRLLQAAESEAAGLAPDMRAFVLWRASYAYVAIDAKKADDRTKDAFMATEAIEDPPDQDQCGAVGSAGDIKSWIQERVLSDLIRKDKVPDVETLLPQATEPVRAHITTELVKHYTGKKDLARAQTLLSSLAEIEQYPFGAAADLLLAMGTDRAANRMEVFNQALNNFEQHGTKNMMGPDDMGTFVENTWTRVPPGIVMEAIEKMLDEAKSKESHSHLSMASEKGSVNLNSTYELRLFQLLPVLQELDKDKAEGLLRENAEVQAKLVKYPKGMGSLTSNGNVYSYGITDDDSPKAAQSVNQQEAMQTAQHQLAQRMSDIVKEAEKDPQQAINDALTLPVEGVFQPSSPRAESLLQIANNFAARKHSSAKSALDEILKFEDQLSPEQIKSIAEAPQIYIKLGDVEDARKALKPIVKAADKLYAHDVDADDPNKAFKGTWPSADLWRKCVQVAAKISPAYAEEIMAEIPDADIAASVKVAYAASLLGQTSGVPILVGDCRKNHSGYNFSD